MRARRRLGASGGRAVHPVRSSALDDARVAFAGAAALLVAQLACGGATGRLPPARFEAYRVDLNAAPAGEIEALPGVGPRLAARIAAERARGPYESVDELRRVRGVGAATIERLRPHVRCVASRR